MSKAKDHESYTNQEIMKLKAHAVEVLAKELRKLEETKKQLLVYTRRINIIEEYKEQEEYINEARALLGWDNENKDKEK